MTENDLLVERRDKVCILTLNRPERLNALSPDLRQEVMHTCEELREDDSVWAVVLTGSVRGFCS